jgi:hypothetical protein
VKHSILIGPTQAAFLYAEEVWRSLPRPSAEEAEALREVFAAAGGPLPASFDPTEATLRRPHCSACYNGIFGGGASNYPGEIALARHGVLLLAHIASFAPEIVEGVVELLVSSKAADNPVALIHACNSKALPKAFKNLGLPTVTVE